MWLEVMVYSEKHSLCALIGRALVRNSPILCSTETGITPCSVIKSKASGYTYSTLRCSWLQVSFPSLSLPDAAVAKRWVSVGRWAGESPVPFFVYLGFEECFHFLQVAEVTQLVATLPGPFWGNWKKHVDDGRIQYTPCTGYYPFTLIWWNMKLGLSEWMESSSR